MIILPAVNLPENFTIKREFDKRFAIGDPTRISLLIDNASGKDFYIKIKDEFPPEMKLGDERETEFALNSQTTAEFFYFLTPPRRGKYKFGKTAVRFLSRLGFVWCQNELGETESVKVYPNMRRAREMELKALGANSYLAVQRRSVRRGEGREFESMRDYVRGDEMRHISWTATARRNKLNHAPISDRTRPDDNYRA